MAIQAVVGDEELSAGADRGLVALVRIFYQQWFD
jgi:hypothetical protein